MCVINLIISSIIRVGGVALQQNYNKNLKAFVKRGRRGRLFESLHFPTQNLLSDAESNICKYNAVIISDITLF